MTDEEKKEEVQEYGMLLVYRNKETDYISIAQLSEKGKEELDRGERVAPEGNWDDWAHPLSLGEALKQLTEFLND